MDIDEIGHAYKPQRGSSTNLVRDRSQSNKRLGQIREAVPKFGQPATSQIAVKNQQEHVQQFFKGQKQKADVQDCEEYSEDIHSFLLDVEKLQRVNP